MKPFKLLNLMKDSILKSFLCMCFLLLVYFWCFFLFTRLLEVLRGRRTWLYPKLWKPGPLMTTWITNGSLDQLSKLREATKQVRDKGRPKNMLVPILNEFQVRNMNDRKNVKIIMEERAILRLILRMV